MIDQAQAIPESQPQFARGLPGHAIEAFYMDIELPPAVAPAPKNVKPLGRKAYGSTAHLPGSRMGPADHHCHEGQRVICEVKARDKHDRVIVTEKLDGSNVAVAKKDGRILALTRAGYLAIDSPYPQHHFFAWWIEGQKTLFDKMLAEGEMINGEWLAMAHGTRYDSSHAGFSPLVVFSIAQGKKRLPWDDVVARCTAYGVPVAKVLSDGPPISVEAVKALIEQSAHGATEAVEGAVWRVESRGQFDFLAKWVRAEKEDGKYLADKFGGATLWNVRAAS